MMPEVGLCEIVEYECGTGKRKGEKLSLFIRTSEKDFERFPLDAKLREFSVKYGKIPEDFLQRLRELKRFRFYSSHHIIQIDEEKKDNCTYFQPTLDLQEKILANLGLYVIM